MRTFGKFLLSFVIFVALCYFGLTWFVDREVGQGIDRAVTHTPGLSLSYADLDVSLVDHSVTLTDVTAELPDGRSFSAKTVAVTRFDQINPVPSYVSARATGVTMAATPINFGAWAAPIRGMGYEVVTGEVDIDYDYDAAAETLTLHTLSIRADNIADLTLTGTVDNLDLHDPRMEKLVGLRMVKAEATLTDRSLVDDILEDIARRLAISVDNARQRVGAEIQAMADYAAGAGNPVAQDVLTGIRQFVEQPGKLTLAANPAEPVPFIYFYMGRDLYENMQLFNMTATTNSSIN